MFETRNERSALKELNETRLIRSNEITITNLETFSTMADLAASLSDWPYIWASFYSAMLLIISVSTFTPAAHGVCEQAGFPQPRNQPLNVYVYICAGSQFMLGLAVAILVAEGEWKAVSVIIACSTPMGLLGTSLAAIKGGMGFGKEFWSHALLTTIGTSAGWRLIQENW